jgi:hypothetical protein
MITPSTGENPVDVPQYDVALLIPAGDRGAHVVMSLLVIGTPISNQGIILIGRDVLKDCYFAYDGIAGHFTLAF